MTDKRRREATSRFEEDGGLLITTGAASDGLSLNFVGEAIHYDLPWSPAAFAQREGRYQRYGRNLPCQVHFLEDEAGALRLEDLLMRMVSNVGLITDEMSNEAEELFREAVEKRLELGRAL